MSQSKIELFRDDYLTPTWRRDDGTPVIWVFAQQGKSPLYDVEVMVVNLQFYDPSKIERGKEVYLPFKIGDMPVGSVWADMDVDLPFNKSVNIPFNKAKKERQDYQINFTARNGWWTQDLLWQKVGDRWLTATRVFREGPDPKTGGIGDIKKLIFMSIEEGFPGEPDWYPGKEALERRKLEDGTEKIDRKPLPDQRP